MRGIALGAFGEFTEYINVLIEITSHEGALNNPSMHLWLKRQRARLSVITAVEPRYAALGHARGTAQQHAAAFHARA